MFGEMQRPSPFATSDWGEQAWHWWRRLPEVAYPCAVTAAALGKAEIGIYDGQTGRRIDVETNPNEAEVELARSLLWEMSSYTGTHQGFLTRWGLFASVVGKAYLIFGEKDDEPFFDVVDSSELESRKTKSGETQWFRKPGAGLPSEQLPPNTTVRTIVLPGRLSGENHSQMQALIGACQALDDMNQFQESAMKSRLSRNGILFVPSALQGASSVPIPNGKLEHIQNQTIKNLIWSSMVNLRRSGTAADWSPIYITGPTDAGAGIRWITTDRTLTDQDIKLRSELREAIAQGMFLPGDFATGQTDQGNHWSSFATRSSAKEDHWLPLLQPLMVGLTKSFLRPILATEGARFAGSERWVFRVDPKSLDQRPDMARAASQLHEQGVLSGEAARSANGFSIHDAPTVEEQIRAIGATTNNLYLATFGLQADGFDLELAMAAATPDYGPNPTSGPDYIPVGREGSGGDPNSSTAGGL